MASSLDKEEGEFQTTKGFFGSSKIIKDKTMTIDVNLALILLDQLDPATIQSHPLPHL